MTDDQALAQPETAAVGTMESTATPQATGSVPVPETQPQATAEDPAELAKRLQQAQLRANQLENENKKFKEAQEAARLAELSETERLREENQRLQAERDQNEAQRMREQFINEYEDAATREAARKLLAKNPSAIVWGDVETTDAARAEVFSQLDAIREAVSPQGAGPSVNPNNPLPQVAPEPSRDELLVQARKTRDFGALLRTIPSVQAQIKSMEE